MAKPKYVYGELLVVYTCPKCNKKVTIEEPSLYEEPDYGSSTRMADCVCPECGLRSAVTVY